MSVKFPGGRYDHLADSLLLLSTNFHPWSCKNCNIQLYSIEGQAAACDCGTPWTFLLTFLYVTPGVFVQCGKPEK